MSELNYEAIRSLHAINQWTDIIESNINGTQRTAYKTKKPTFTLANKHMTGAVGGTQRPPGAQQDLIIPSAALVVSEVRPEMIQGNIVDSTEETHLAIQGVGYFVVTDTMDMSNTARQIQVYFTRDGEFHWDQDGFLRTQNGLFVANATFPPFDPQRATITAGVAANTDSYSNYFMSKTRVAQAGPPPTTAADLDEHGIIDVDKVGLARFSSDAGMEYSKFGTSYLQEGGASGRPIFFSTVDPINDVLIKYRSLESSTGSMTEFIPMLSSASKMFAAVSKIIAVYNSTVDDMNGLIR